MAIIKYDSSKFNYGIDLDALTLPITNLPPGVFLIRRVIKRDCCFMAFISYHVSDSCDRTEGYILERCKDGLMLEKIPTLGVEVIERR